MQGTLTPYGNLMYWFMRCCYKRRCILYIWKRGKRHTIPSWIVWKLTSKVIDKSGKLLCIFGSISIRILWTLWDIHYFLPKLAHMVIRITILGRVNRSMTHFYFWSHDIRIPIFVHSTINAFINLIITNLRHMWSIVWTVWLTILKLLYAKNKFLYWLFFWGIQIN